eukprot:1420728-Rhodomonas_salina.1
MEGGVGEAVRVCWWHTRTPSHPGTQPDVTAQRASEWLSVCTKLPPNETVPAFPAPISICSTQIWTHCSNLSGGRPGGGCERQRGLPPLGQPAPAPRSAAERGGQEKRGAGRMGGRERG